MPAADSSSSVQHPSRQPGPRQNSIRYRPSKKTLRKPSNQNPRGPRLVTPKRGETGILKVVDYDVHSASPPQRGPSTPGNRPNPTKQEKRKVRGISAAMFRNRLPSPTSSAAVYTYHEEDETEPCPSPVVGDSHYNERLGVRYTKLPNLQESRDWRKNIEARLLTKSDDVLQMPLPQHTLLGSQRTNGFATAAPQAHYTQFQTDKNGKQSQPRDDAESIIVKHGLCGIPSIPTLSGLRPRHSIKRGLSRRHWLHRTSYNSHVPGSPDGDIGKQDSLSKHVSVCRPVRSTLTGRSLKTAGNADRKTQFDESGEVDGFPGITNRRQDEDVEEGPEPWQTKHGVYGFHRESMNFGDFREAVERGWQSTVHSGHGEIPLKSIKPAPKLAPAFEEEKSGSLAPFTPTGSPGKEDLAGDQGAHHRQSAAIGVLADEYGSPQVQSGRIGVSVGNSAIPAIRIVEIETASTGRPPLPGPRTSSKSAMRVLCMPFEQFGGASSSVPQDSPTQSTTVVPLNHKSGLKRQTAGTDLRSRMLSITSTGPPAYGSPAITSTDTLTMIEAQAHDSCKMSSSGGTALLNSPAVAVRNNKPSGDPPERPLPEIPDYDQLHAERMSAGSRASSRSRRYSRTIGSISPHQPRLRLSSGRTIRAVLAERASTLHSQSDDPTSTPKEPEFNTTNLEAVNGISHCNSVYSQTSIPPTPSYPRPTRRRSSGRADRVHALKKRDITSSTYDAQAHYRHHRRISEEDEDQVESSDQLDKFPAIPASRPANVSRSRSRTHSRQHSRSQSGASQTCKESRTFSASHHARANKLTHQILAQSNIMVWADTNPITALFRAGAMSPSPSIASVTRSPSRRDKILNGKASRRSIQIIASDLPTVALPQPLARAHMPPNSTSSVTGDLEESSPGLARSSPVKLQLQQQLQQQKEQERMLPVSSSPRKRIDARNSHLPTRTTALERFNISSEIEKIGTYLERLESDRSKAANQGDTIRAQKKKIERLEYVLSMLLKREYWVDTRADGGGNGNGSTARWRGAAMLTKQSQSQKELGAVQPVPASLTRRDGAAVNTVVRPISEASQISTTPSASTGTTAETELSLDNGNCHGSTLRPINLDGWNEGEGKRLSNALAMTNIENIDGMLRELRLSKSTGNVGMAEVYGKGRATVRRDERGLVLGGW